MKALVFPRNHLRFAAAMTMSRIKPGVGAAVGPLRLEETEPPELPGPGWTHVRTRLAGICGSDLATIDGRVSRYFEPLVSFPMTPGHEVVADAPAGTGSATANGAANLTNGGADSAPTNGGANPANGATRSASAGADSAPANGSAAPRPSAGARVVLEPVLGAEARGEAPAWLGAAPADGDDYGHLIGGRLEPGLQTGSCASTGGGWAEMFAAHSSQLHSLGSVSTSELSDEAAVMIEPTAAATHAVLRANVPDGGTVAVIGAGTMGLAAVAALRAFTNVSAIVVAARYPHQRSLAVSLGADLAVEPDELVRAVRRAAGTRVIGHTLGSGTDATIDAVASSASLSDAVAMTRPRGRVVVLGMPAQVQLDLSALWHRETELVGAYCYGTEHGYAAEPGTEHGGKAKHTFELATQLVRDCSLENLVSELYALEDYKAAISHAAQAGQRGSVKIAFDLRDS